MAEEKLGEESAPTSSGRGCSGAHSRVAVMKMNRRLKDARPVECCSKVVNYSFCLSTQVRCCALGRAIGLNGKQQIYEYKKGTKALGRSR